MELVYYSEIGLYNGNEYMNVINSCNLSSLNGKDCLYNRHFFLMASGHSVFILIVVVVSITSCRDEVKGLRWAREEGGEKG